MVVRNEDFVQALLTYRGAPMTVVKRAGAEPRTPPAHPASRYQVTLIEDGEGDWLVQQYYVNSPC